MSPPRALRGTSETGTRPPAGEPTGEPALASAAVAEGKTRPGVQGREAPSAEATLPPLMVEGIKRTGEVSSSSGRGLTGRPFPDGDSEAGWVARPVTQERTWKEGFLTDRGRVGRWKIPGRGVAVWLMLEREALKWQDQSKLEEIYGRRNGVVVSSEWTDVGMPQGQQREENMEFRELDWWEDELRKVACRQLFEWMDREWGG